MTLDQYNPDEWEAMDEETANLEFSITTQRHVETGAVAYAYMCHVCETHTGPWSTVREAARRLRRHIVRTHLSDTERQQL